MYTWHQLLIWIKLNYTRAQSNIRIAFIAMSSILIFANLHAKYFSILQMKLTILFTIKRRITLIVVRLYKSFVLRVAIYDQKYSRWQHEVHNILLNAFTCIPRPKELTNEVKRCNYEAELKQYFYSTSPYIEVYIVYVVNMTFSFILT